jgi:hypothetical protein
MKSIRKTKDDTRLRASVVFLVLTGICLVDQTRLSASLVSGRDVPFQVSLFARSSFANSAVGRHEKRFSTVGGKTSRQPLSSGLSFLPTPATLPDFSGRFPATAQDDRSCSLVHLPPPSDRAPPLT